MRMMMVRFNIVAAIFIALACFGENASARYMQSDPVGLEGGVNTYTYVNGNPLSYTDPLGLTPNPAEAACVAGPNPVCIGGATIDIVTNAVALAIAMNAASDKELQREIEKEANRREYKRICDESPPSGLDPCELAKWNLNKAQSCKAAREANTKKWWGGEDNQHSPQLMQDLDNAIRNAQAAVDRACKCPKK